MTGNAEKQKTDSKRDQLAELLRRRAEKAQMKRISPGQQKIFRLASMNPEETHYNLVAAYRLDGPLNTADVLRAVDALAARHDVLRALFAKVEGDTRMKIAGVGEIPVPVTEHDLSPDPDREEKLRALVAREASRPFDFEREPLWRFVMVTLGPSDHAIVLNMHHAISDGRSFDVFLQELRQLLAADGTDADMALPPTAMRYADYAARQCDFMGSSMFEEQLDAWRLRFAHPAPPLILPGARADAYPQHRDAAGVAIEVSQDTTASLAALSRQEGATVFMVLIAGLQAALMRITGQDDMVISVPVSGRHRARTRDIIGYFNNILPVRLDGRDNPTLLDLLRRARREVLASFKAQDVPFETIAALPGLRRASLSRLIFSLEDAPWPPDLSLEGLACRKIPGDFGSADFDIGFQFWWEQDRLVGNVRYKSAVFEKAAVERLVGLLGETLDLLATAPERSLAELPAPTDPAFTSADSGAPLRPDGARRAPRTALEMQITRLWQEEFAQEEISIDDSLMDLGASSLAVASLLERIDAEFTAKLSVGDLFKAATVAGMARMIKSCAEGTELSPVATIRAGGHKPPLFLCEGVGIYFDLAAHLEEGRPVYGLITDLTEDFPSVKDLAVHYVDAICKTHPTGPCHLGGVSFGGLVAFETARLLKEQGRTVGAVALLDAPAPGAYRPKPLPGKLLGHSKNLARFGLPYLKKVANGRKAKRLAAGSQSAKLAADGAAGDMSQVRNLFRKRLRDFEPSRYDGDVALFKLKERDGMSDSLFDPALGDIDPFLGWRSFVGGNIATFELPGDHIGILRDPVVSELAAHLDLVFDRFEVSPG